MANSMIWTLKKFDDLTVAELYSILQLRNEVFVVEQDCVYQDADNRDQSSFHFMGWINSINCLYKDTATGPGLSGTFTRPGSHCTGCQEMVEQVKNWLNDRFNRLKNCLADTAIRIGAQLYLLKFYTTLGSAQSVKSILKMGIEHIEMIYQGENS
jgi:ElaA protein